MSRKCTICKLPTAPILYGMPSMSVKMMEQLDKGELVLGGCCISGHDPVSRCVGCNVNYWKGGLGVFYEDAEADSFTLKSLCKSCVHYDGTSCGKIQEVPTSILEGKGLHMQTFFQQENEIVFAPKSNFNDVVFELSIGGYGGPSFDVQYYDGVIRIEHAFDSFSYEENTREKHFFVLTKNQRNELEKIVESGRWRKGYMNHEILDGTQWSFVRFLRKNKTTSWGSNKFPKAYKELLSYLEELLAPSGVRVF